jgi:hypothetical protein
VGTIIDADGNLAAQFPLELSKDINAKGWLVHFRGRAPSSTILARRRDK